MKIWLGLNKKYEITLADGGTAIGITKFYRTPNTDDYLPIVLMVDGKEVQINPDGILRIKEVVCVDRNLPNA